jgi:hypothetical protein
MPFHELTFYQHAILSKCHYSQLAISPISILATSPSVNIPTAFFQNPSHPAPKTFEMSKQETRRAKGSELQGHMLRQVTHSVRGFTGVC